MGQRFQNTLTWFPAKTILLLMLFVVIMELLGELKVFLMMISIMIEGYILSFLNYNWVTPPTLFIHPFFIGRFRVKIKVSNELDAIDFVMYDDVVKKFAPLTCLKFENEVSY
jgi:hypothetical protein